MGGDLEGEHASTRLRFEPFFVSRAPVFKDVPRCQQLQRLGVEIFDQRPGQGLAFVVATGAVRDFPIELSSFLVDSQVDAARLGDFLGEDFSLSQTLRLEFINAVRLTGTGVVSSLAKVFKHFRMPSDMMKIDRLMDGIAQIWWRQHEQLEGVMLPSEQQAMVGDGEVEGLQLMAQVSNYSSLYQLLFSTVMLHWSLYAPLPASQRVTLSQWLETNEGIVITRDGLDRSMLQQTYTLIYRLVSRALIPQLRMWPSDDDGVPSKQPEDAGVQQQQQKQEQQQERSQQRGFSNGPVVPPLPMAPSIPPAGAKTDILRGKSRAAADGPDLESWGRLLGGFPSPACTSGTITYHHVRSILCESSGSFSHSPANSRQLGEVARPPLRFAGPASCSSVPLTLFGSQDQEDTRDSMPQTDKVWMTLRQGLLFLASKPKPWAPHSFVSLGEKIDVSSDSETLRLTVQPLGPQPLASTAGGSPQGKAAPNAFSGSPTLAAVPRLSVVFLLPDGRWQILEVARLQMQLANRGLLDRWHAEMEAHCRCSDRRGHPRSTTALRGAAIRTNFDA